MHWTAYVLLPVDGIKNSEQARASVDTILVTDPGFCFENSRFAHPICDGFQVGGRASGELYPQTMLDEFWKLVKEFPGLVGRDKWVTPEFTERHSEKLNGIWNVLGGGGLSPLTRADKYLGYDDDARILDDQLVEMLDEYLGEKSQKHEYLVDYEGDAKIILLDEEGKLFDEIKSFAQHSVN